MNPLDAAYQRGLTAFIAAVEASSSSDVATFRRALRLAFLRFGVRTVELAARMNVARQTIGKWVNAGSTPGPDTREVIWQWLLEELRTQLRDGVMTREEVLKRRAILAYADESCPERECDRCHRLYRGPAVYCSLTCATADATG